MALKGKVSSFLGKGNLLSEKNDFNGALVIYNKALQIDSVLKKHKKVKVLFL